jgi:hypothetical protein
MRSDDVEADNTRPTRRSTLIRDKDGNHTTVFIAVVFIF